jgi:hypothetical protein
MLTKEVVERYKHVEDMMAEATDEEISSPRFLQNLAGELLLIIKEAGGVYPEAHGRLSQVFLSLNDKKRAQQEYQIALQQDPYAIGAWKTRLLIALEPYAGHTEFKRGERFVPTTDGVVGAIGRSLVNERYEAAVIKEFNKLLDTYRQLVSQTTDAPVWITMSEFIIQMADYLHENKLVWHTGSWPNLYTDVANAPWSKVEGQGYDNDIADIRQTAEGRLLLYPSAKSSKAPVKSTSPVQGSQALAGVKRPTGVTIIAVLAAVSGVLGIGAFSFSPLLGLLAILNLAFAYGSWTLKPWGWTLGVILQILAVLLAVVSVLGFSSSYSPFLGLVISVIILYYLLRQDIKIAFGRA